MKKKVIITIAAAMLVFSGIAYAAAKFSNGKVVAVDGKKVTIELEKSIDLKAGDKVKVEALGGGKPGFSLQGC
jgi:co-chaperonin GroES (HSP10)